MPSWSDSERNKMFLAMIELMAPHGSNNKLPSWTLVAERMESGFTGEAVRYVFMIVYNSLVTNPLFQAHVCTRIHKPYTKKELTSISRQQFQKCRKEGLPRHIPPRNSSGKSGTSNNRSTIPRSRKRFSSGDYDDDDEEASLYSNAKKRMIKKEADEMLAAGLGSISEEPSNANGNQQEMSIKKEKIEGNEEGN